MALPLDLVFVRHGESEGNAAKRRSRTGDHSAFTPEFRDRHTSTYRLTDRGRRQAVRAGEWLRKEFFGPGWGFDRYYVSDYTRAKETAGLLGLPNATWYSDYNIRERDWGDLDVCPEDERQARFGEALRRRDAQPFYWAPPGSGSESLAQLCARLKDTIRTLHRECGDRRVLIVCHGEVMWAFRVLIERMSQERFKELHESQDTTHRIHNCQVLHYKRRNPETGELSKYADWVRSVRPTATPEWHSGWQRVVRPRYTNEELLALADLHEPMVA